MKDGVVIGEIVRPHGIRGELKVIPTGSWPAEERPIRRAGMRLKKRAFRWIEVTAVRKHGDAYIIRIAGVNDRTEAEQLRGGQLLVKKGELPRLEEDTYYKEDLIGLAVSTTDGEYIGRLEEVFSGGGHDIYVVRNGEKEVLIPAVKAYIKTIDLTERTVTIEAVEGLLD